jgi:two-component system nitrogen regulation response regulator NtrX
MDDERNICLTLKQILNDENYKVKTISSFEKWEKNFYDFQPDIVILDVQLDLDLSGLDILKRIKRIDSSVLVIMISGHSGIKEAVQAIKYDAFDFLEKPLSLPKVKITLKNATLFRLAILERNLYKQSKILQYMMVGSSKYMKDLQKTIMKVAKTNAKVLVRGESGTGKELVAYAIHSNSSRADKPFIKFNSAAIPNELVESELFGYEAGAFTGAIKTKRGKLEEADEGSLFLDEIGDMSLTAQAKILRVIQEGEFERVGSNIVRKINVRIIAATHKNLEKMIEENKFREDLYYRLNVIPINIKSLREHSEDIPDLINHFSKLFASEMKLSPKIFDKSAIKFLQNSRLKGNIRELKNLIERVYILSENETISAEDFLSYPDNKNKEDEFWSKTENFTIKKIEFEKKYLNEQLRKFNFNVSKTAQKLGLHQSNLSRKIKELKINIKIK